MQEVWRRCLGCGRLAVPVRAGKKGRCEVCGRHHPSESRDRGFLRSVRIALNRFPGTRRR